ncbi:LANO_0G08108g1_1 [Lachancea nothofagi CBS 11611]|uniref:Cytidine deaminase n=1 Tax=Lachancea nothofagi CBS 11611 TaxID=1266666 RepID=A0A1G4KHQ2_9SACH|nr:LANO_0G08108g1_1 [Lachancea nothofagi CBS 11611]
MQVTLLPAGLSGNEFETVKKNALKARELSYSPYSKFRVGCCIMTGSRSYILGANVENASYGAGICAERTAIVKAVTSGYMKDWICLAISGDSLESCISPCGICRQAIREFASLQLPVVMFNGDGSKYIVKTLQELLPLSFGPEDLQEGSDSQ